MTKGGGEERRGRIDFGELAIVVAAIGLLLMPGIPIVSELPRDLAILVPTALAAVATIATAVFTFAAARAASHSASAIAASTKELRRSAEAEIVGSFLRRYSSPEMSRALQDIREWYDDVDWKSDSVAMAKFSLDELLTEISPTHAEKNGVAVDDARRLVHYYFKEAYSLYRSGFLSEESLAIIVDVNATELMFTAVRWLSIRAHPGLRREPLDVAHIRDSLRWIDELREMLGYEVNEIDPLPVPGST